MRALVITSDDAMASRIARRLSNECIDFDIVRAWGAAWAHDRTRIDVVLLDPRLPDSNGPEAIRVLKREMPYASVVICSDRDTVEAATRGFGFGADANVVLPDDELTLAETLYRLLGQAPPQPLLLRSGNHVMELFDTWLRIDGQRVHLSKAEFRLVDLLAHQRGEVISKAELLRHAASRGRLDHSDDVSLHVFDVYLTHARRIMSCASGGHNFIRTVWGRGYTFNDEVDVPPRPH